ncbi:MAG: 4Fe-4S binding protein [Clostridiaceae bacterium]|nr:4Fe-4S binding protein [Clostridiaceae bacterium]
MKIRIYYFSSTGNTKCGLLMLQNNLTLMGHNCELLTVEKEDTIRDDCDLLGFASPVYGGCPAKIVIDFIERSKRFTHKVPAFTVLCPCSSIGYWGSREVFMDVLASRNIQVIANLGFLGNPSHPIVLGSLKKASTFIKSLFDGIGRPDSTDAAEIRDFSEKLITIYQDYSNGKKIKKPRYSRQKRWVSKIVRSREIALINSSSMKVLQDKCVQCGICQKECPVGALSLNPYPEKDLSKCFHCQKCINVCPKHALFPNNILQIDYYKGKAHPNEEFPNQHTEIREKHRKKSMLLRILSTGTGMVIIMMMQGITNKILIQRANPER